MNLNKTAPPNNTPTSPRTAAIYPRKLAVMAGPSHAKTIPGSNLGQLRLEY